MEGRKWENLHRDCLVNVFDRVGLKGLPTDVPLVCKSWHKASLDPLCWKCFDFPHSIPSKELKLVVDRSCGRAIHISFPFTCSLEDLVYTTEKCPALESVCLPSFILDEKSIAAVFPSLQGKWRDLKLLVLDTILNFAETLTQISTHCKNLEGLIIHGGHLGKEEFLLISMLSKIKYLKIRTWSNVTREELLAVLDGGKELEKVYVSECVGFDPNDEVIMKKTSHISFSRPKVICLIMKSH